MAKAVKKLNTNNDRRCAAVFRAAAVCAAIFLGAVFLFVSCERGGEGRAGNGNGNRNGNWNGSGIAAVTAPPAPAPSAAAAAVFPPGTFVEGVGIAGLTKAQAEELLSGKLSELESDYSLCFSFGGEEFVLTANDVELESGLDAVLEQALAAGGSFSIPLAPKSNEVLEEKLRAIAERVDTPPQEAELLPLYAFRSRVESGEDLEAEKMNDRFAVTKPRDGVSVDMERALAAAVSGVRNAGLPVRTIRARGELPELPERLGAFSTAYSSPALSAENRVANIKKAAGMLNGRSLDPGCSLSCNRILGERTVGSGWLPAAAFANGGTETIQQPGGGICQVSTTLYNCALLSGLNVTERHGHSRRVAYAEGGRDAALNWGTSDLVIQNGGTGRVYLFMWTDDAEKRLYCELYGSPSDRAEGEISIESEFTAHVEPGEPVFTVDPSLSPGECVLEDEAREGSVYRTYRVFTNGGKEIRREFIDETTYLPRPARYAVAPGH